MFLVYKMINLKEKNIPDGWQILPLSNLCNNLDNRRIPITKSDRVSGDIPYYGATGIIDYVGDFIFDEEILVIGEDGADWLPFVNKSFIVKGKSWVNNHAHVLKAKGLSSNIYLEQYLNWVNLDIYTTGGTRKKLNKEVLMELPVCLPKLKLEQEKIAEILSKVDEDIEKTEKIIEETGKIKSGLMQELLTKGIGHTKFKKTKLGEIPENWQVKSFNDCFDVASKLQGLKKSDYKEQGRYPIIDQAQSFITGYTDSNDLLQEKIPTIIFGDHTRILKYIDFPYVLGNDGTKIIWAKKENDPKFLFYSLLKLDIPNTGYNRHFKYLEQAIFAVPKKPEQEKITEILSSVDEKITVNKKLKEKLIQLKKGLMSDLLNGKVRVK